MLYSTTCAIDAVLRPAVLAVVSVLLIIYCPSANAQADAQGWNGPGWYITSAAEKSAAAPAYILFEGPHDLLSGCLVVYNRFYSPIGNCRLLDAKPPAFSR